jgi:hypothetical protein
MKEGRGCMPSGERLIGLTRNPIVLLCEPRSETHLAVKSSETMAAPAQPDNELRQDLIEALLRLEEMLKPLPGTTGLRDKIADLRRLLVEQRAPRVALVGRRGSGKSSLVNALFGRKVAELGHEKAQTGAGVWWQYGSRVAPTSLRGPVYPRSEMNAPGVMANRPSILPRSNVTRDVMRDPISRLIRVGMAQAELPLPRRYLEVRADADCGAPLPRQVPGADKTTQMRCARRVSL